MLISETSFSQAVEGFKKFLSENNLPTEIIWVFCEDVFSRNNKIFETDFWIKLPVPSENEKFAEIQYEIGQRKGLGIGISAFAVCENKVCCGLVIPKDQEDSEYLFMSPQYLKFSFLTEMPTVKIVESSFLWKLFHLLPFKFKKGNFLVYLESKNNLQFPSN